MRKKLEFKLKLCNLFCKLLYMFDKGLLNGILWVFALFCFCVMEFRERNDIAAGIISSFFIYFIFFINRQYKCKYNIYLNNFKNKILYGIPCMIGAFTGIVIFTFFARNIFDFQLISEILWDAKIKYYTDHYLYIFASAIIFGMLYRISHIAFGINKSIISVLIPMCTFILCGFDCFIINVCLFINHVLNNHDCEHDLNFLAITLLGNIVGYFIFARPIDEIIKN